MRALLALLLVAPLAAAATGQVITPPEGGWVPLVGEGPAVLEDVSDRMALVLDASDGARADGIPLGDARYVAIAGTTLALSVPENTSAYLGFWVPTSCCGSFPVSTMRLSVDDAQGWQSISVIGDVRERTLYTASCTGLVVNGTIPGEGRPSHVLFGVDEGQFAWADLHLFLTDDLSNATEWLRGPGCGETADAGGIALAGLDLNETVEDGVVATVRITSLRAIASQVVVEVLLDGRLVSSHDVTVGAGSNVTVLAPIGIDHPGSRHLVEARIVGTDQRAEAHTEGRAEVVPSPPPPPDQLIPTPTSPSATPSRGPLQPTSLPIPSHPLALVVALVVGIAFVGRRLL